MLGRLIIAGVVVTSDKLISGVIESIKNPGQGLITSVTDTSDNLSR